jgi:hypothetical protein
LILLLILGESILLDLPVDIPVLIGNAKVVVSIFALFLLRGLATTSNSPFIILIAT